MSFLWQTLLMIKMKTEPYSERLENLLIQKLCEMGNLTYIIRRKNAEIEKMESELEILKNVHNEKNLTKNQDQDFFVANLTEEEKTLIDVFRAYNRLLGRDPDMGALRTYTNNVLAGKSIDWVKEQIKQTEEYKQFNKI